MKTFKIYYTFKSVHSRGDGNNGMQTIKADTEELAEKQLENQYSEKKGKLIIQHTIEQ